MKVEPIELENLVDEIPVALTYTDSEGTILYRNRTAAERPSPGPRDVGLNISTCHAQPGSLTAIARIFDDFKAGRKTPHRYVSHRLEVPELITLVPIFKDGRFEGCLSVIHPLEIKGVTKTF